MGVVLDQSVKNLVTTYLGFGVGAVNVLLLYPNFLEPEYYGLVTFLLSAGSLVWPFMAFGAHNSLVKFHSFYRSEKERDSLLTWGLFFPLLTGLLLGLAGWACYDLILDYFDTNSIVRPYVWLIFVIAISVAYFEVFFAWGKIRLRSVFGNFMREVFHRVCVTVLLLLVFAGSIRVEVFIYLLTAVYVLRTLVMALYAFDLYFPKLVFQLPSNRGALFKYTALMFVAGAIAMVLLDLDKFMIEHYLPIENVSIYGIAIYIASVIAVPSRAMHQITYPMTATLMNQKDKPGLNNLYQRSSVSLLVVGGLVFLLIIANVKELYRLIPEAYHIGMSVVLLIGLVKLYDNLLGNANSILFNSNYYRLVLFLGIFLVVSAIVLNILLIPPYGIYGAAYATFIAFFVYNTMKLMVVYRKFNLQPFTPKTGVVLLVILVMTAGFYFWDFNLLHPLVNIALKSLLLSGIYIFLVHRLRASDDVSALIRNLLRRKKM